MAKGDAEQLRADMDDGYTGIANLLVEALACCPLTSTEYAVCLFIMRRTYGIGGLHAVSAFAGPHR